MAVNQVLGDAYKTEYGSYCAPEVLSTSNKPVYEICKRVVDILISLLLIVVLLIPMALIYAAVRLDSPGAGIYRQERLGKNGKPFTIYKFRSMYIDAELGGPQWATENDCRCTRVGHFLRVTHLDELPQLFNVLSGSMSLVGPRPERAYFYNMFEAHIEGFSDRLQVTPGITGWAQVHGGYMLGPAEKLSLDMEYIRNRSLRFDFICLIHTVKVLFTHNGAR